MVYTLSKVILTRVPDCTFDFCYSAYFAFQPKHFPFLNIAVSRQVDTRCRTLFYTALGRLLLVELGENEGRFERFISPIIGEATGKEGQEDVSG